jgi:transcriptional regulator with XRE-family HTH domain
MIPVSVHKRPRPHFPLERLLRARSRSQYSLAKQTKLSTTYLNRIARGKVSPGWKVILLITDALGVNLGELTDAIPHRR